MLEPGTTVDTDRSTGGDWRLSVRVQPIKAAQPVGLSEPSTVCGATQSIPGAGRAAPSLCRGWTKPEPQTNMNPVPGLTHGVVQKSEPGQPQNQLFSVFLVVVKNAASGACSPLFQAHNSPLKARSRMAGRSEEHTSELQSRQ